MVRSVWIRGGSETVGPHARRLIAAAALVFSGSATALAGQSSLPEVPYPERDVSLIRNLEFTGPHIPPIRTSADGRIGLHSKILDDTLRFHLLVPERLERRFIDTGAGIRIFDSREPYRLPESRFRPDGTGLSDHVTICDPTGAHFEPGESPSPYGCGEALRDDCYDLIVISSVKVESAGSPTKQLWGTPITARVANPKTADAAIVEIEVGEPVAGAMVPGRFLLETMTTSDGHLIVGRIDTPDYSWRNPSTLENRTHFVDIVYSFYPSGSGPCDVTRWDQWYPISHAPHDFRVNGAYGFAFHPFRDAEGNRIPDGADLRGSYPWIDRNGANLFFTAVGETLVRDPESIFPVLDENAATYFPTRCATAGCSNVIETRQPTRGQSVLGLWTSGKMVLLDGVLNNVDWSLPVADDTHRLVQLYRGAEDGGHTGEVLVGSGRDVGASQQPPGSAFNVAVTDSLENLFHAHANLVPVTSRDIVWIVNNGKASDEVAFDDLINPDALVVSEMVPAMSFDASNVERSSLRHASGPRDDAIGAQNAATELGYWDTPSAGLVFGDFARPLLSYANGLSGEAIRIQNAATAPRDRWVVPAAGVGFGNARAEPVALGGVRGRGLWVDGDSGLRYEVASQPRDVSVTPWYLGIFLNLHVEADGLERVLYRFPDGHEVRIVGRSDVLYLGAQGNELRRIALPKSFERDSWSHLGLQFLPSTSRILLYLDGFLLDDWTAQEYWQPMVPGGFFVGGHPDASGKGVVGWIDELKIIAQDVGFEVACNHSRGTLVELPEVEGDPLAAWWRLTTDGYPSASHEEVMKTAGSESTGVYLCFQGEIGGDRSNQGPVPPSLRRVRTAFTFPEGPLVYNEPRPDSSSNPFCLSCHIREGLGGLSLSALQLRADIEAQDDRRRQPSQPFRRVFGNVPAHWLGQDKPSTSVLAPSAGISIDALLASAVVPIPTVAPTRTPTVACPGDCDGDGRTSISELVTGVSIGLGRIPQDRCAAGYSCDHLPGCVGVADLVRAVNSSLFGCGAK